MSVHHVPKYRIRPKPERLLAERFLLLALLGILLYFGIYLNYYILGMDVPALLKYIIIASIMILISLELILCYVKYGNYSYDFYDHWVDLNSKKRRSIKYSQIESVEYTYNALDKLMHTGSIELKLHDGKSIKIQSLGNPNQAYLFLQKIIRHSRI